MLSRFTGTVLLASLTVLVPAAAALPTLERTIAPGAGAFNGLEMALADFRGDGRLQVVAQSDDGSVYVLDPRTGTTLARFAPGNAGCTSSCYSFEGVSGPINAPQVTDMDGDGLLDVVVANTAAVVARYEFNSAASTATKFVFDKKWEHRYNNYQSFTTMDANPVVADLNGDGSKDVVVVTEEVGVFAVRADGSTLWALGVAGGHASPSVRDLDGDGRPEVVIARDDGIVEARSGSNGASKWAFDARSYVRPASVPMAPTLSDITGDGKPDVLFMARDAHDASNFASDHAMMFALDHAGKLLWRFQPSWAPPLSHTRPVVVSVGGQLAVLGGTWNTIGHKPGNFERVGAGQVFLLDAQGREKWHRDLNAGSSNKDLAVADVVGDGSQQVIAPGTSGGKTGWLLFDLATGAPRGFLAAPTPTRSGAAVGDLFGDGKFAMAAAVQASGGSVQVWHGTQGLSSAFPGWGAVRIAHGTPSAGGGGSGGGGTGGSGNSTGALTASFTPKGNEWWVEAIVSANHPLASVSATVNGGAPVDLPKTSWGTWAKSIHAASGAVVQFTARDAGGATVQSPCYAWVTFAPATCGGGSPPPPPPPPPGGTFTATFTPRNGNEWWVQAGVSASQPLAGVDAQVGTGAWQPLTKQSYGDWAGSMNAPAGSTVHLRARSTGGDTVVSPAYTWPVK